MEKDLYFVAVKVFLEDGKGNLLIIKDIHDDGWDIPGGRLRPQDFETPLEEVIARKMKEELGNDIAYEVGAPVIFMRHERDEYLSPDKSERRRIFAIGYQGKYLWGDIHLGKYLKDYKWVPLETFKPEEYFTGGWLNGVKEYIKTF